MSASHTGKREAARDAARRRILEAALAEVAERGYGGATTAAIARRAGVTEMTLFRHLPNKARLLEELPQLIASELLRPLLAAPLDGFAALAEGQGYGQAVEAVFCERLTLFSTRPELIAGLLELLFHAPTAAESFRAACAETLSFAARFHARSGDGMDTTGPSPERLARIMLALLLGTSVVDRLLPSGAQPPEAAAAELGAFFLKGSGWHHPAPE